MTSDKEAYRFNARALDLIEQAVQEQVNAFSWARLAVDDRGERSEIGNAHQRGRELKALLHKLQQQQQRDGQDLRLDPRAIALIEQAIRDQISAFSPPESLSTVAFVRAGDTDTKMTLQELENLLSALRGQ
jgi:hypothetical protein